MTITQLASYIQLSQLTLYKKVQAHEIPFTKVGNLLRFTKTSIDQWLERNTFTPSDDIIQEFIRSHSRTFFRTWLESRGIRWRTLSDAELAAITTAALADLRSDPGGS